MIQPLRTVHRRTFITLSVVLPAILLVALGARHSPPPEQAVTEITTKGYLVKKSDTACRKHATRSGLHRDSNHPQDLCVIFESVQDLNEPDLLVYWTGNEPQGVSLPAQARLLGALSASRTFVLPRDVNADGYLVLYSLAQQTVVDTAAVEKLP